MAAEQLFEIMGYKKEHHEPSNTLYYERAKGTVFGHRIFFSLTKKKYGYLFHNDAYINNLNIKQHQAIHQQLIELGWLEEAGR